MLLCPSDGEGCTERIKGPDVIEFVCPIVALCQCWGCADGGQVDCSNLFYGHMCICLVGPLITGLELEQCKMMMTKMAMTERERYMVKLGRIVWTWGQLNPRESLTN